MPVRRQLSLPPWGAHNPGTDPYFDIPEGYVLVETDKRVQGGLCERGYRTRWMCQREVDRHNAAREIPSYRYAVHDTRRRWPRERYFPVPFQNVLVPQPPPMKEGDHA
jgi:hypothetical protein